MRWDARQSQPYEEASVLTDNIRANCLEPCRKGCFKRARMILNLRADLSDIDPWPIRQVDLRLRVDLRRHHHPNHHVD